MCPLSAPSRAVCILSADPGSAVCKLRPSNAARGGWGSRVREGACFPRTGGVSLTPHHRRRVPPHGPSAQAARSPPPWSLCTGGVVQRPWGSGQVRALPPASDSRQVHIPSSWHPVSGPVDYTHQGVPHSRAQQGPRRSRQFEAGWPCGAQACIRAAPPGAPLSVTAPSLCPMPQRQWLQLRGLERPVRRGRLTEEREREGRECAHLDTSRKGLGAGSGSLGKPCLYPSPSRPTPLW